MLDPLGDRLDEGRDWLLMSGSVQVTVDRDPTSGPESSAAPLPTFKQRPRLIQSGVIGLIVVYVGWNLAHLAAGQLPGSLMTAIVGLPCPTSGGTRAISALLGGDVITSLRWNPLAVPITVLFVLSLVELVRSRLVWGRVRLGPRWVRCWMWLLATAWLVQLAIYFTVGFPDVL